MAKSNSCDSGGLGFIGALTLLFIALKFTGYISWSWLWVLSPIWISASVAIAVVVFYLTILLFGNKL